jgi:hypothetical protein
MERVGALERVVLRQRVGRVAELAERTAGPTMQLVRSEPSSCGSLWRRPPGTARVPPSVFRRRRSPGISSNDECRRRHPAGMGSHFRGNQTRHGVNRQWTRFKRLVRIGDKLIQLFDPPFDKSALELATSKDMCRASAKRRSIHPPPPGLPWRRPCRSRHRAVDFGTSSTRSTGHDG